MTSSALKKRVVFWNPIPTPYLTDNFNAIVRRGHVDLEVWFGARTESDRSWVVDESDWKFPYRFLPRIGYGRWRMTLPVPMFAGPPPDLIVMAYWTPSFLLGLVVARARGWKVALWVEATFSTWVRRRRWKEVLKRLIFPSVQGVMTPGPDGRAFAMRYGARVGAIHLVRNVVDVAHYATARSTPESLRLKLRAELDLVGVVFVYVGRLWWGKGLRTLLASYSDVEQKALAPTSLLLVGDGPEQQWLAETAEARGLRVRLAGFRQRAELPRYYAASDVFVFPTLGDPYGLVVDEAMAAGLPVISTTAVGEIAERVINGVNGYLVPPNDQTALTIAMNEIISDADVRHAMGLRSASMIAPYSPDTWAEAFELATNDIADSDARLSPK